MLVQMEGPQIFGTDAWKCCRMNARSQTPYRIRIASCQKRPPAYWIAYAWTLITDRIIANCLSLVVVASTDNSALNVPQVMGVPIAPIRQICNLSFLSQFSRAIFDECTIWIQLHHQHHRINVPTAFFPTWNANFFVQQYCIQRQREKIIYQKTQNNKHG